MPRAQGSGRIWDNNNRGGTGNVGAAVTTLSGNSTTPADTISFQRGPNPEPYLLDVTNEMSNRTRASYVHQHPEIPVQDPWIVSSTYIQNVNTSPAQPKNQVAPALFQGSIRSVAPPMTTQRDNLYDAADSDRVLQRFHFAHTQSQRYFDEKQPIPEFNTPGMYTHAVIAGGNNYFPTYSQSGWRQQFVPEFGQRGQNMLDVGTAPPTLLSTPLNVHQIVYSEYDTARPLVKGTAPKRRRSGG
jgi:hypothetical protein